jgi:hypothetical protein
MKKSLSRFAWRKIGADSPFAGGYGGLLTLGDRLIFWLSQHPPRLRKPWR